MPALVLCAMLTASAASDPARNNAEDFFGLPRVYTFELTITADNFHKMPPPSGRGGRGLGGGRVLSDDSGYPKVPATLRFDGKDWGELAVRYKGNSSYRGAPSVLKRSLKLEFDSPDEHRTFFGLTKLNLNNNAFDPSQMREALSYEVFRRAGVPAPRTAYAKVYITVPGEYERQYAGLFTIIEQIDQRFFRDRWNERVGLLIKPEGLRGLPVIGDDWRAYEVPYGSKVTAKREDAAVFISFVKLVNEAPDDEFARRIGDYLDVDEFLRFLASEVLVVNTDSPLAMNHNYWMTVHPKTHKVVWLPWDMNMSFGGFRAGDADLSLREPSAPGMFPLAQRVLATTSLAARYDVIVRNLLKSVFTKSVLNDDIQRTAAAIRQAVDEDSTASIGDFDRHVTDPANRAPGVNRDRPTDVAFFGRNSPPLLEFITERIVSVTEQLDGTRTGTPGRGGRGGFVPPGARVGPFPQR